MTESKFLKLLPGIRQAAKSLGYAVGLHGSLARDFDLIAVPWTDEVADPNELALKIMEVAEGTRWRVWWDQGNPKPHGRRCYAFDWGETNENKGYCDLSVMPRLIPQPTEPKFGNQL